MNECSIRLTAETQTYLEDWMNYLGQRGLEIDWEYISICRGADKTHFHCNGVMRRMSGATDEYPLQDEKIYDGHGW